MSIYIYYIYILYLLLLYIHVHVDWWTTKVNFFFSQYPQLQEPEILELQNAFGPETLAAWKPVNLPPTQPPLRNQGFYQGLLKGNPWVIRGGDMLGGIGWLAMRNGNMLQSMMGYFSGNTHNIRVHFHLRVLFSWISIMSSFDFGLTSCGGDV